MKVFFAAAAAILSAGYFALIWFHFYIIKLEKEYEEEFGRARLEHLKAEYGIGGSSQRKRELFVCGVMTIVVIVIALRIWAVA